MKNQILGIFFYFIYLLAMMRPVAPLLEYYANYDYIAAVLCENRDRPYLECNGKCYLQKQLAKLNEQSQNDAPTIPKIALEDYPLSPLEFWDIDFNQYDTFICDGNHLISFTIQECIRPLLRPPKLSFYIN